MSLRFADWPLRGKVALLLVVASTVPLVAGGIVAYRDARRRATESAEALLAARVDQVAGQLDLFHRTYLAAVRRLARLPSLQDLVDRETEAERRTARRRIRRTIDGFRDTDDNVGSVVVVGADGRAAVATDEAAFAQSLADRGYVRDGLVGRAGISEIRLEGGAPSIAYYAPVRSATGAVRAVAVLYVEAESFWDVLRRGNGLAGPGSYGVLADASGIRMGPEAESVPSLSVSRRLEEAPWTVTYYVPVEVVNAGVASYFRRAVALGTGLVALGLAAGWLLSSYVLRPVGPLSRALERLSSGDYRARVPVERNDELGKLGAGYNRMAEALEAAHAGLEAKVEERTRELAEKNREVERATRLKSEFLANMSHELRTPLNSIIGFSELLVEDLSGRLPEEQLRQIREIHAGGRYLLGLINDILDIARIEAGGLTLEIEDVDVLVAVRDALRLLEPAAQKKRISLVSSVRTERTVVADQRRLRQVLLNLAANAVKFSPEGAAVELSASDDGEAIRFEVRDRGPGVDLEQARDLFRPFVQGESPLEKKQEGAGLGLAIARSLVEHQGGAVGVREAEGGGAVFWFTLPAAAGVPGAVPREPASHPAAFDGDAPRVLVVDDHDAGREVSRALLERLGCRVETATGGEEAVARVRSSPPDVVLMDLRMPGMDGYRAAQILKADPRTAAVPLIAFTVHAMPGDRERARDSGFDDFLAKPVEREALRSALLRHRSRRV